MKSTPPKGSKNLENVDVFELLNHTSASLVSEILDLGREPPAPLNRFSSLMGEIRLVVRLRLGHTVVCRENEPAFRGRCATDGTCERDLCTSELPAQTHATHPSNPLCGSSIATGTVFMAHVWQNNPWSRSIFDLRRRFGNVWFRIPIVDNDGHLMTSCFAQRF